jgi:hypothetical protein
VPIDGQGLFITLEDHIAVELHERLAEWKRLKEGTDLGRRDKSHGNMTPLEII